MTKLVHFVKDESGVTAIEYALVSVGMALALIAVMPILAGTIQAQYSSMAVHLTTNP